MATSVRKTPRSAAARATATKSAPTPVPNPAAKPAAAPAPKPAASARSSKGTQPAVAPKATKPGKPAKEPKAAKPAKVRVKLVRDSFAMPEADVALIAQLKERALEGRRPAKKSELLRAGLHALTALSPAQLVAALDALMPVKTGRPKKGH